MGLQEVWTLCRIFKRIISHRKFSPNWKQTATKLNPTDSIPKACSLESDNSEAYSSFEDLVIQQNDRKPFIHHVDERDNIFLAHSNSTGQVPFPSSYSNFWSPSADDFLTNGNWDELRSVVQLTIDPSHVYDCR